MLTLRNSTWVLYVGQWWAVKWFTILNKTIILLAIVFDIWTKFYNFVFFLSSRNWKPVPKDTLRKVLHYLFFDIFKFLVLSERQTVVLNLYFESFNIFKTKTQYIYTWIIYADISEVTPKQSNGGACDICHKVIDELVAELKNNATSQHIKSTLKEMCSELPTHLNDEVRRKRNHNKNKQKHLINEK